MLLVFLYHVDVQLTRNILCFAHGIKYRSIHFQFEK